MLSTSDVFADKLLNSGRFLTGGGRSMSGGQSFSSR
jgi:hypothetical protein